MKTKTKTKNGTEGKPAAAAGARLPSVTSKIIPAIAQAFGDHGKPITEGLALLENKIAQTTSEAIGALSLQVTEAVVDAKAAKNGVENARRSADAAATNSKESAVLIGKMSEAIGQIPATVQTALNDTISITMPSSSEAGAPEQKKRGADAIAYLFERYASLLIAFNQVLTETKKPLPVKLSDAAVDGLVSIVNAKLITRLEKQLGSLQDTVTVLSSQVALLKQNNGFLTKMWNACRAAMGADLGGAAYLGDIALVKATPLVIEALRDDHYSDAVSEVATPVDGVGTANVCTIIGDLLKPKGLAFLRSYLAQDHGIIDLKDLDIPQNAETKQRIDAMVQVLQRRATECLNSLKSERV